MTDRVLVFVDALPYQERERLAREVPALTWARAIEPGFGYSLNVKSELFAGLAPDQAGFLNEWTYRPGRGITKVGYPRWFDRLVSATWLGSRVVRRVLAKLYGESLRNIPLPLLTDLDRDGVNAYERGFPHESVFTEFEVERFLYSEFGSDGAAFEALLRRLDTDERPVKAFLATAELDHVLHVHAVNSPEYEAELKVVIGRMNELLSALQRRGEGARVCLVSDHGMASVHSEVTFELDTALPGAGKSYGLFVDATMARVWSRDEAVLERARSFAGDIPGHYLDAEERRAWGISSPEFGDLVFLLDEGYLFVPSFMGDAGVKAMHGYDPRLDSQKGLLAANVPVVDEGEVVPARAAYQGFRNFFS